MRNFLLCALATLGLALGATVVWGVGSAVTLDPSTGKTYPQQVSAGYLATADGGVVNVLNSPAPTAVGQALLIKSIGPSASANWATIPGAKADMIWTIRSSAADNNWYSVTYGNGTFVAVAYSGTGNRVMTSPDGITWTIRSSAADNNWYSVTYGNGTFVAVAATGTGNRVMTSPPWTNTPLSSSVPPLVAAGPGVAGTGTSAQRSDSQQGLSATNPNKGDFFRSPTGTDTATNTGTTWDHALDLVRYAGSGTADPTAGAGVPCLLASGSPLSMCLYYQTVHCNDGGCSYAIWWKSGSGDTQWTQFGTGGGGGGGGSPPLSNSSPMEAGLGGYGSAGSSNAAMRADAVIPLPFPTCKPGQTLRYGTMTATGTGTATATTTTITCQNN
jgi:hypothetical protein